jgi:hypothetical protein
MTRQMLVIEDERDLAQLISLHLQRDRDQRPRRAEWRK